MREKLISRINEETGMPIGLVALCIALVGCVLAFTALPVAGGRIAAVGILLGLLGMVIHFVKNWRSIFHVDRE